MLGCRVLAIAAIHTLGIVAQMAMMPPPILGQAGGAVEAGSPLPETAPQKPVGVLTELYQKRDRLAAELNSLSQRLNPPNVSNSPEHETVQKQYEAVLLELRTVEARIQVEQSSQTNWEQAIRLANQAVDLGRQPDPTPETWQQAQFLWQESLEALRRVSPESFNGAIAAQKIQEYQKYLDIINQRVEMSQAAVASGILLYGDTNRDGVVNVKDSAGRDQWTWLAGGLMLFNNDDDDGNSRPDWQDLKINGDRDVEDLAQVHLRVPEDWDVSELAIAVDAQSQGYVNVFQRTASGWIPVDVTGKKPITFSRQVLLGVEAKQFATSNWNGIVNIQAIAKKKGQVVASDTTQLRVVPWIMSPNTAPVNELYVSNRGQSTDEFVARIKEEVEPSGVPVTVDSKGTVWMQDTMEIGYVQFPSGSSLRKFNVVLNGNRGPGRDIYAPSLLSPDFGWFEIGKPRQLDEANKWADWYGNLEVTPPIPNYPLGRIYYGTAGTVTMHPDVVDFLTAQEVQGPPVAIDTSWLMIRHVDEIISFIPTPSGEFLMLIVSPEAGVKMLEELDAQGNGDLTINRSLSTETTVRSVLNDQRFIEYNLQLQRDKINPIVAQLKREFQLKDKQIIQVPAMFGYKGNAWWPNMVNSVVVNSHLLVSNPRGALIDGNDYTQEVFRKLVARGAGGGTPPLQVDFLDDWYYQERQGNTHCATNTRREGLGMPFWQALPSHLGDRSRAEG